MALFVGQTFFTEPSVREVTASPKIHEDHCVLKYWSCSCLLASRQGVRGTDCLAGRYYRVWIFVCDARSWGCETHVMGMCGLFSHDSGNDLLGRQGQDRTYLSLFCSFVSIWIPSIIHSCMHARLNLQPWTALINISSVYSYYRDYYPFY